MIHPHDISTEWLDAPPVALDADAVSLRAIASALAVAESSLTAVFPDVEAYLLAAQRHLFACRLDAVVAAAAALPKGRERMRCALDTYLDFSITKRPVLKWFWALAARFPALAAAESRRIQAAITLAETEFRAIGVADSLAAAKALIPLLVAVARSEAEAGAADAGWRERLYSTLDSLRSPDRGGSAPAKPPFNA